MRLARVGFPTPPSVVSPTGERLSFPPSWRGLGSPSWRGLGRLASLKLAAISLAAGLGAQEPAPGTVVPSPAVYTSPPIPTDLEAEQRGYPVRSLQLEDALRMGRVYNVGLRAAELLPEQAQLDLLFAEAAFVPELYASVNYSDSVAPSRNAFQPSVRRQLLDGSMGWRQRTVTGGMFDLAFRPARLETSGSAFFPDKLYTAEFGATFRQPLLRGGWTDYNLAPVDRAKLTAQQARQDNQQVVQDTMLQIVQAYWELVFARESYGVTGSALAVAQEQLRITDERIRVKALATMDRVADEAEVARRQEEMITAENDIRAREDVLRRLLFDASDPQLWRLNLRPVSAIAVVPDTTEQAFEPLVEVALARRADLRGQRAAVARAEVALLEASRDALPQLDFLGGWSSDSARDRWGSAWNDAVDREFPDWAVGLEFSLPLGNQAAQARQQRAALELERQRRLLAAAALDVTQQVRDAVRTLRTVAQSILATQVSVRLALTNLETEQVRLRLGATTAFEVQRRNQDLLAARTRLLRNQLDYRVAQSRLLHVQGLLEAPR